MTRINVVSVAELADQHLLAEYRELPRVLKQNIDISNAPNKYCLGKGHVKWARKHWIFAFNRFKKIIEEMQYRGFQTNFSADGLMEYGLKIPVSLKLADYKINARDVELNRQRLQERIVAKSHFYKWTNRPKPIYAKIKQS